MNNKEYFTKDVGRDFIATLQNLNFTFTVETVKKFCSVVVQEYLNEKNATQ